MSGERLGRGALNRILQLIALYAPGAETTRVRLHRLRGVSIGQNVFIGMGAMIETSHPQLVSIGNGVAIGIRATIIAHAFVGRFVEWSQEDRGPSVRLEDDVTIGPGAIVLPNVTVGYGAVVSAGSVVTRSVPPLTLVQGNPAAVIAQSTLPLARETPIKEYYKQLKRV